jgi:hypothetical protein
MYTIDVYKRSIKNPGEEVHVAHVECGFVPEDPDRFAWELGGERCVINELKTT